MAIALLDFERQNNNIDGKKRIKQLGISSQGEEDKKKAFKKPLGTKMDNYQEYSNDLRW